MSVLIFILLALGVILGPQIWAKRVLTRYNGDREDFPGTGIGFARHILAHRDMPEIRVETTEAGDHYDPVEKVIRLNQQTCGNKSLTAVVAAAHEVGQAIQDKIGYQPLRSRTQLVRLVQTAEKIGAGLMMAIPIVAGLTHVPAAGLLMFLGGMGSLGIPVVIHLMTLPVEWDASFNRALPILAEYLPSEDWHAARRILVACSLTYVARSLVSLLDFWRWIRILRR